MMRGDRRPDTGIARRHMLAGGAAVAVMAGIGAPLRAASCDDRVPDAVLAGFPLFEFARTAWAVARPTAERPWGGFNLITHRRRLTDPTSRIVTTPNNDCLVSTARIDLTTGPVMLTLPDITDRYFSAVLMDAFTDNFFFVGTRATGGRGGRFLITPPGWRGTVPAGTRRVTAPTQDLWLLVRILINGPAEYPRLNALQDRIMLDGPNGPVPGTMLATPPRDVNDPVNFLAVVNAMLARAPAGDRRVRRAQRFAAVGIGRDKPVEFAALPAPLQACWRTMLPLMLAALPTAGEDRRREANGWSYSLLSTGNYGDDDLQRAQVALAGLAALPPAEAFYAHALRDAGGTAFDGGHRYQLRIPPGGPPVNAFWSLTMYQIERDGRLFLTPNPIDRYSIGDRTRGLVMKADGSLDIVMQRDRPVGPSAANWLPTPAGPFRPALRAYLAKPALLALRWKMPAIERIG